LKQNYENRCGGARLKSGTQEIFKRQPSAVVVSEEDYSRMGGNRQCILELQKQMAKQATVSGLTSNLLDSILRDR